MINYRGENFNAYNAPKRTPGKTKKFAVLARSGNKVRLIRFGEPGMAIKSGSTKHRANFRARHRCDEAKDIFTARYWSCKAWDGVDKMVAKRKRTVKKKRRNPARTKRSPAQIRATNKLVRLNKARARNARRTAPKRRKTTRTTTRRRNPIKYVIQAFNARTGDMGYFTGDAIDDNVKVAKTYDSAQGAVRAAKKLFDHMPATWRLMVVHEHRPR